MAFYDYRVLFLSYVFTLVYDIIYSRPPCQITLPTYIIYWRYNTLYLLRQFYGIMHFQYAVYEYKCVLLSGIKQEVLLLFLINRHAVAYYFNVVISKLKLYEIACDLLFMPFLFYPLIVSKTPPGYRSH